MFDQKEVFGKAYMKKNNILNILKLIYFEAIA